jgi:hypothetical protein
VADNAAAATAAASRPAAQAVSAHQHNDKQQHDSCRNRRSKQLQAAEGGVRAAASREANRSAREAAAGGAAGKSNKHCTPPPLKHQTCPRQNGGGAPVRCLLASHNCFSTSIAPKPWGRWHCIEETGHWQLQRSTVINNHLVTFRAIADNSPSSMQVAVWDSQAYADVANCRFQSLAGSAVAA